MVERRIRTAQAVGSIPTSSSIYAGVAQLVEHRFCTPSVAGSIPVTSSIAERRVCLLFIVMKTAATVSLY